MQRSLLVIGWFFLQAVRSLKEGKNANFVDYAPSLMTSLGLFGTFLGIFIGLLQFDPERIDGSIQQLLHGLQTAFVTSLFGMMFAIWFKFLQTKQLDTAKAANLDTRPDDVEPKDIHEVLLKQHAVMHVMAKGIGGSDERSLVGQLQMLRTDVVDFRSTQSKQHEAFETKLSTQLEQFAGMVAQAAAQQGEVLGLIAKGIGGNDERSMVGQMQMLRTDVVDFRTLLGKRQEAFETKLWAQLDQFAEMMSKAATQQVIDALRQVIIDFNERLTEQFGQNFQRLDAAVTKLVEWQDTYRTQMDEMTRLYGLGIESIGSTKVAVESIRVETSRIPADMQQLSEVITINQHQINELARHLDAFVVMRDQAVAAVPQIQEKLEQVGQQLLVGADKVNAALVQGSQQFEDSVKTTNQSLVVSAGQISSQSERISGEMSAALEALVANTERIRTSITNTIAESMAAVEATTSAVVTRTGDASNAMLRAMHETLESAVESGAKARTDSQRTMDAANTAMVQHADRSLQAVEKQVQEAVNRTNEAVNAQLRQLDQALSNQLNAALQELGSSLASIAGHLMETYQQGVDRGTGRS